MWLIRRSDDCIDYEASLPSGLSDYRVHQAQIRLFSKQFALFKDAAAVWQLQQRESEEQHMTETRAGLVTPTSAASNIQTTHSIKNAERVFSLWRKLALCLNMQSELAEVL